MREVLTVVQTPTFGGPHNQMARISELLRERGWKLAMLLPEDVESKVLQVFEAAGVEVELTRINRMRKSLDPRLHANFIARFGRQCREIESVIRRRGSDVVQICGLMTLQPALAAKRAGVPVVWQLLSTFAPEPLRTVLSQVVKKHADVLMSTGEAVARSHRGLVDHFGERWIPYFCPVDTSKFRFDRRARAEARAALRVPEGALLVGTVGNQNRQKGHDFFVQAAAEIAAEREDVYFRICGQETAANRAYYQKHVIDPARSRGLFERERLTVGPPPLPVEQVLAGFDVFTLSSRTEGTPTALMEAMSVGIPSVAPSVGSTEEIITDGSDGLIVPPEDPSALAAAWRRLLEDNELRERFSQEARETAVARFDVSISAARHAEAYELAWECGRVGREVGAGA